MSKITMLSRAEGEDPPASKLAELCRQIESIGRAYILEGAEKLLVEIETEHSAVCDTLLPFKKKLKKYVSIDE
jgi:hypothetical protein